MSRLLYRGVTVCIHGRSRPVSVLVRVGSHRRVRDMTSVYVCGPASVVRLRATAWIQPTSKTLWRQERPEAERPLGSCLDSSGDDCALCRHRHCAVSCASAPIIWCCGLLRRTLALPCDTGSTRVFVCHDCCCVRSTELGYLSLRMAVDEHNRGLV